MSIFAMPTLLWWAFAFKYICGAATILLIYIIFIAA